MQACRCVSTEPGQLRNSLELTALKYWVSDFHCESFTTIPRWGYVPLLVHNEFRSAIAIAYMPLPLHILSTSGLASIAQLLTLNLHTALLCSIIFVNCVSPYVLSICFCCMHSCSRGQVTNLASHLIHTW